MFAVGEGKINGAKIFMYRNLLVREGNRWKRIELSFEIFTIIMTFSTSMNVLLAVRRSIHFHCATKLVQLSVHDVSSVHINESLYSYVVFLTKNSFSINVYIFSLEVQKQQKCFFISWNLIHTALFMDSQKVVKIYRLVPRIIRILVLVTFSR